MHDTNGTELKKGDRVLIPAVITELAAGDDYCNVTVETTLGRRPDGGVERISAINTGVLVKHVALLIALCLTSVANAQQRVTSSIQGLDAWTQANRQGIGVETVSSTRARPIVKEATLPSIAQQEMRTQYASARQSGEAGTLAAYLAAAAYTGGGATAGPGAVNSCPCGAACVCGPNCRCPAGCPANCPCQVKQAATADAPPGKVWVCRNGRCSLVPSLAAFTATASASGGSCAVSGKQPACRHQRRAARRAARAARRTSFRMAVFGR